MSTENNFYIYFLFRPWDGSPCYVGKGRGKRWKHHGMLGKKHYNKHLANIFAKAERLGTIVICIKHLAHLSEEVAFSTEVALIAAIGRGANGPLVNMTDGGEGMSGYVATADTRRKMHDALVGRTFSRETLDRMKASKQNISEETRKKMSASAILRGTPWAAIALSKTPEARAKISAAKLGKPNYALRGRANSPETCAKLSAAATGRVLTESHKAKISLGQIGRKHSAESRAKIGAGNRGKVRSEAVRARISATKRRQSVLT